MPRLTIKSFAHIREATIDFGDLTVLVGAQGTGKSLALQWLKAAIDGRQIVSALSDAGQTVAAPTVLDQIFGDGMGAGWKPDTVVRFDKRAVRPSTLAKAGDGTERLFYIPAHRALLISDGWALPFRRLGAETPVVARLFSQNLFDRFSARQDLTLFPLDRVLKREYRSLIDDAVFHGGVVRIVERNLTRRLMLSHGEIDLPFMTWTAGQREFTPLLLGLYHLLPPRKMMKVPEIDWVVIEEPEMGLHPQAITVFMLLVLDLLWRGYRVVLSTHSPLVLTAVWMLRRLQETGARWQLLCDAFGIDTAGRPGLKNVATSALTKELRTHLLRFDGATVISRDVSSLDPGDEDDDVSGWGGLTEFSSRFGASVRRAANEADVE